MSHAHDLIESLVKEYLAQRAFSQSFNAFTDEIAKAKDGKLQIDKFIEEMFDAIEKTDVDRLCCMWETWQSKVFNSLSRESIKIANQYEANAYRMLLVKCVQNNDLATCNKFFNKMSSVTLNNPQWTEWYTFPYNPHAREMEPFKRYYDKQWREVFAISLHNFLSISLASPSYSSLSAIVETLSREYTEMSSSRLEFDEELMDDFAVIAQCTSPIKVAQSKTSLKSLFKSFGKKQQSD
ncbi:unnamed protein product [Caenorhabditis auriculariae]|uniref:ARMC9 CTLH-like domain-containing protein n=1 Tax=Caenorhabditis auriculariae TaxID=2777116 RepID=A0A8S1GVX8_9PELO|nr:unnamed protein product [Caenorhabditis auriculariae]